MNTLFFPNGLSGIIYDCDGVMLNSRAANTLFYNRVLAHVGLPPMNRAQEEYTYMATGMQSLEHILPKSLHPKIGEIVQKHVHYSDVFPHLTLMPGFLDFVVRAEALGLKQAMCTNRTDAGFAEVMRFFSFPPVFDPIMTTSRAKPKPDPDGVMQIVRAWGLCPTSLLFIGDSLCDREAAEGAGVRFAAYNALGVTSDIEATSWSRMAELIFGPLS
ncbi:MAG: HAD family hydrolase [Desulfovibrionaceae bacterium]|nr:HAD family hydrolase [Desulfovibrionaceae bacterium]